MARVSWVHFGMVLLGVVLIIGSLFLGIVATEYEITHEGSTENMTKVLDEIDQYGMTRYEELSAEGQRIVDGTIDGTQYRFDTGDERALMWSDGRVVARDDQYHVIPRRLVVDWASPAGIGAVLLGVGGLVSMIEAIRRHHFPNYRPFVRRT